MAKGSTSAGAFTLSATVRETPDGSPGDSSKVDALVFGLSSTNGVVRPGCTASGSGITVDTATGVLTAVCTVPAGTPIDVYDVSIAIPGANRYYQGSAASGLVVYDPASAGAVGSVCLTGRAGQPFGAPHSPPWRSAPERAPLLRPSPDERR